MMEYAGSQAQWVQRSELQGLKALRLGSLNVAVKTATHKDQGGAGGGADGEGIGARGDGGGGGFTVGAPCFSRGEPDFSPAEMDSE